MNLALLYIPCMWNFVKFAFLNLTNGNIMNTTYLFVEIEQSTAVHPATFKGNSCQPINNFNFSWKLQGNLSLGKFELNMWFIFRKPTLICVHVYFKI